MKRRTNRTERTIAAGVAVVAALLGAVAPAAAEPRDRPDAKLTPGAIATENVPLVCRAGYARAVRPKGALWRKLKDEAYGRYGLPRGHRSEIDAAGHRHAAFAIDHLIPIELGGAPADVRNLWPQPRIAAKHKDEVENELHAFVCAGRIRLATAQHAIARNWKSAVADALR
jgi:hypothetical protein